MIMDHPEVEVSGESKSLFRKLNLNFIRERPSLRRKSSKDEKCEVKDEKKPDEKPTNVFSNLFDKKASIFSRKNSKPNQMPSSEPDSLDGSDWTIV